MAITVNLAVTGVYQQGSAVAHQVANAPGDTSGITFLATITAPTQLGNLGGTFTISLP